MVKIVEESSPYFKIISPKDIGHKVAPGVPSVFRILFTPEENKVMTTLAKKKKSMYLKHFSKHSQGWLVFMVVLVIFRSIRSGLWWVVVLMRVTFIWWVLIFWW